MISKHSSLLLILSLCYACTSPEVDHNSIPPPNIVWITSEDNSKHYLELFDPNGVPTPNVEKLTEQGLLFTHAFSNGPVCSVARSAIISGCYGPRIGTQFHRKYKPVPMPQSLKMFPYYLRKNGYYTTNNSKKDYNIIETDSTWDESSDKASWRNKSENQPFFHVYNIGLTHESKLHFKKEDMDTIVTKTELQSFNVQPNHPDTELFRYTNAFYRDKIVEMDQKVGEVIDELEKSGRMDDTFIFYFGDHGGVLPGSKGYLYETGLHVPMVVHVPKNYRHLLGGVEPGKFEGFVSFVDLAPTVLNLAGIPIPEEIDGKAFLGKGVDQSDKDKTFSYSDRMDEKYDMVRAVRKGKYKYIRNFQPQSQDALMNNYRYKQLAYEEWNDLYEKGELNNVQSEFFKPKEPEYLFDIESDPFETRNLADKDEFTAVLLQMRKELNSWMKDMPDLSLYPEHFLIDSAFSNPVEFGRNHKADISKYLDIANLSLSNFDSIENDLVKSLRSKDVWERYWALNTAISFGAKANVLVPLISDIVEEDSELINKVKASEFLGIVRQINPTESILTSLYSTNKRAEALLILNSIVLMESKAYGYDFDIEYDRLSKTVRNDNQIKNRLKYLKEM